MNSVTGLCWNMPRDELSLLFFVVVVVVVLFTITSVTQVVQCIMCNDIFLAQQICKIDT